MPECSNLEDILNRIFGFSSFRYPQKEIVSILNRKDTLAVLPTGAGKSLCFQLPAVILPGTTLVISPLLSLMKDQVEHCLAKGIAAGYIGSNQSREQQEETLHQFRLQHFKLLYVSPERLQSSHFIEACQVVTIPLVVIDEAHCLSTWGHDFRPQYRFIPTFIRRLSQRPTIAACTASATPHTQTDICHNLQLQTPMVFQTTFRRPNLSIQVITVTNGFFKDLYVLRLIKRYSGQPLIIYTATRERSEYVVELIHHFFPQSISACYHAGLEKSQREAVQNGFQQGTIQIIAATSAFGMGVDKATVRCVIHYQLPSTLEDYYQEAGRAGRDGQPSECFVLATQSDVAIQQEMLQVVGSTIENHNKSSKEKKLDFQHQQKRVHKFKQLLTFFNSSCCRQILMSYYFGEKNNQPCRCCDNCTTLKRSNPLFELASQEEIETISHLVKSRENKAKRLKVSSTQIMSNQVLLQTALLQPKSHTDSLKLSGVGTGLLRYWQSIDFFPIVALSPK